MRKKILVILLVSIGSLVIVLLLFSGVWRYIVKTHLQQFDKTLPEATVLATQKALTEKAALQATEYRTQRAYLEAQNRYDLEKIRLRTEMLPRYAKLKFYGALGILMIFGLSLLILSGGYARARIKQASVCTAKIGKHSAIPVHTDDLKTFYPIAANLSLAEIEASVSTSHEKAYQISRQMIEDITTYTRVLAGQRGLLSNNQAIPAQAPLSLSTAASVPAPTFANLLKSEQIAPGKPLIFGYHQGQPEHRNINNLKSLAVAGWQGSGKTSSTAYIIASSALAYGIQTYVIDPHKNHDEGLYSIIQPLEATGQVTVINPFDTPRLIEELNTRLDRRLAGAERSEQGILLVIDELARLAKMECFDKLLIFLERCTEETRKANITFIGCSTKWTARHFKGRADIRGCMNSALVHRCKVSQAELLIEDSQEKKLVKHLERPGEAILMTDFAGARKVQMPYCTRQDMENVARLIGNEKPVIELHGPELTEKGFLPPHPLTSQKESPMQATKPEEGQTELDRELEDMLSLPQPNTEFLADLSTEELLRTRTQQLVKDRVISYGKIQAETGIAKSTANNFVKAGKSLRPEQQTALKTYLERLEQGSERPAKAA